MIADVALDLGDLLADDVVGDDGGERDEEADAGGDERLGDAAHDVAHRALFCPSPSWWKASMTPMTVPRRPTKGALLPSVPEEGHAPLELASLLAHLGVERLLDRARAAVEPRERGRTTEASIDGLSREELVGAAAVAVAQSRDEIVTELVGVVAPRVEEDHALDHDARSRSTESPKRSHRTHALPSTLATLDNLSMSMGTPLP